MAFDRWQKSHEDVRQQGGRSKWPSSCPTTHSARLCRERQSEILTDRLHHRVLGWQQQVAARTVDQDGLHSLQPQRCGGRGPRRTGMAHPGWQPLDAPRPRPKRCAGNPAHCRETYQDVLHWAREPATQSQALYYDLLGVGELSRKVFTWLQIHH